MYFSQLLVFMNRLLMGQMYLADSLLLLLSSSSSSSSSTFRFTDSIRRSTYVFIDEKEMGKEKMRWRFCCVWRGGNFCFIFSVAHYFINHFHNTYMLRYIICQNYLCFLASLLLYYQINWYWIEHLLSKLLKNKEFTIPGRYILSQY